MFSDETKKDINFRANLFLPRWDILNRLEKNPIVKSSYFWFFLVPIAAKTFEKIGNEIVIAYNSRDYIFHFSLPFSWQLFFFSSCFFILGSIAFKLFCPHAITEHSGFREFNEEGKGYPQINGYYIRSFLKRTKGEFSHSSRVAVNGYLKLFHEKKFDHDEEIIRYLQEIQDLDGMNKAYWYTYTVSNQHRLGWRFFVSVLYSAGFILFLFVMVQNIKYVFQQFVCC